MANSWSNFSSGRTDFQLFLYSLKIRITIFHQTLYVYEQKCYGHFIVSEFSELIFSGTDTETPYGFILVSNKIMWVS